MIFFNFWQGGSKISLLDPKEEILQWIKNNISHLFPSIEKSTAIDNLVFDVPPLHVEADYMLSTFDLKEVLKEEGALIAGRIAEYSAKISLPLVEKIYAIGPYINIVVNRELYCIEALNLIKKQKNFFGAYRKGIPRVVYINYPNTSFRSSIMGKSIGRIYELQGSTVLFNDFTINNAQLISAGINVIRDSLKYRVAEYVPNTNAVLTLPKGNFSSQVLQRNDKSLTDYTLYLAYIKNLTPKIEPSLSVYIFPLEQAEIVDSLIAIGKTLKYIPSGANVSTVFVNHDNAHEYSIKGSKALQYALLRIPASEKALLTEESFLKYSYLVDSIHRFQRGGGKTIVTDFTMVKLLMDFPKIISDVLRSYQLEKLCTHLEKIQDLCKEKLTFEDKNLSKVVTIVLHNGLRLLTD